MRRWPQEADQPIRKALPAGENVPGATKAFRAVEGRSIAANKASLFINGEEKGSSSVAATDKAVTFKVALTKGSHELSPIFHTADGGTVGAYYVIVRKL